MFIFHSTKELKSLIFFGVVHEVWTERFIFLLFFFNL